MTDLEETIEEPVVTKPEDIQVEEKVEDEKEKNWKAFLEKRKEEQKLLEQEREKNKQLEADQVRRSKELEDMKVAFQAMIEKKDDTYYDEDTEKKKLIEDEVKRLFDQQEQNRKQQEAQSRYQQESIEIKKEMPDLFEVCSQENLAYLEYHHPEIAVPLGRMPDGFEKTKLAYQAIRKHVKMNTKDEKRIDKNLAKPKSVHTSGSNETQQEQSSGNLSDKRKNEVWQKMQRLISGEDED